MNATQHEQQALLLASKNSLPEHLTELESAWIESAGTAMEAEMLEYHRSRHRDGTWRQQYDLPVAG
jgi:hypothetical protein